MIRLRLAVTALSGLMLAACGGSAPVARSDVAAGDAAEPPDIFQERGWPPSELPVRWIEAAPGIDQTREYFEDVIGSSPSVEGGDLDITQRGHLVLTRPADAASIHYDFTVFHVKFTKGVDTHTLIKTEKSSGTATIETIAGKNGPLSVYRLVGGASPDQARVFVRFGTKLRRAFPKIEETRPGAYSLSHIATATSGRVEITESVDSGKNQKVRLRLGQELVVRLERSGSRSWSLPPDAVGKVLMQFPSTEEPGFQVFKFKGVLPGWADLKFSMGNTVRVKVERQSP